MIERNSGDAGVTRRLCFVGDSITNGTLDATFLGWPGRLCAAARQQGHDLTHYNLGIRGDTSTLIEARWRAECQARLPDHTKAGLVFAFGVNDTALENGALRVPPDESLVRARRILSAAKDWLPVLWIGPAPLDEAQQPLRPAPGVSYDFQNDRIEALSHAYAALAQDLGVPYLDVYTPLSADDRWQAALRAGDGVHPTAAGYERLSALIADWSGWQAWLQG